MRYKRRGVDKNGNVANYVETEQLIHVHNHTLSYIQTRGSVPVFWSQVGYRYNPRPRLDKSKCLGGKLTTCHLSFGRDVYVWKDEAGLLKVKFLSRLLCAKCSEIQERVFCTLDYNSSVEAEQINERPFKVILYNVLLPLS